MEGEPSGSVSAAALTRPAMRSFTGPSTTAPDAWSARGNLASSRLGQDLREAPHTRLSAPAFSDDSGDPQTDSRPAEASRYTAFR